MQKLQQYELDEINNRLKDQYGLFESTFPYFQLVWSDDQYENRKMTHTNEGFELIHPEVRLVPKYRHYIRERYILEGLRSTIEQRETDLVEKITYEPIWTFEDKNGNFLTPIWKAIWYILETVRHNQENAGKGAKYKDPELIEGAEEARYKELYEALYGNETPLTTALSHRSGVAYGPGSQPNSSKGDNNGSGN